MIPVKILDSYALLALFEDEPGADIVLDLLLKAEKGRELVMMTAVNLGEVWYALARVTSEDVADNKIGEITAMRIGIRDVDWGLARQAAVFKAKGGISFADCFCAALAVMTGGTVVTGDPEFKKLGSEVEVLWLGIDDP